ncbi:MAG TPA: DUF4367 domain-containing protein [Candidatus Galloscillospira excrementavium]|nr:DUF4367 domain-containing protein [Candidatus Galloscillospira excrementavium]
MDRQSGGRFDADLRAALLEAARLDWVGALSQEPAAPRFSQGYLDRRAAFLSDPIGYVRRLRRRAWSAGQRALRAAACLLLVAGVAFGALMAASPTARAWVQRIFIQWLSDRADITFQGNPQGFGENGLWRPTWLPEGFELAEENIMSLVTILIYENEVGDEIFLHYTTANANIIIDTEHQDHYAITVHGSAADFFPANEPGEPSYLIWTDEATGTYFDLMTYLEDSEVLLQIAESIRYFG